MSELIKTSKIRQQKLKTIIKRLHEGATVEEVQEDFSKLTNGVSATEITEMEQALVNEGMPITEIQRLCDVHAAVFKGSIEDIHKEDNAAEKSEGHPIHSLKTENFAIQEFLDKKVLVNLEQYTKDSIEGNKKSLLEALNKLMTIEKHYSRKENLIFPIMEKYDITAPPQVMWAVDDEIRDKLKAVLVTLNSDSFDLSHLDEAVKNLVEQINEMIFKEEEIMTPMVLDKFTLDDWKQIEQSSTEIGYTLIPQPKRWDYSSFEAAPNVNSNEESSNIGFVQADSQTQIKFDAGSLTSEEVNSLLNTVPLDMTFVGADNRVKYFTQGKERVFDRPITIIGRQVKMCHPPKSVHIVEQIVEDLQSGKKDNEDFWIKMGDMFVYIRYFAVRNKKGEYLGTLEVTQNIKPIMQLEGEKRLKS